MSPPWWLLFTSQRPVSQRMLSQELSPTLGSTEKIKFHPWSRSSCQPILHRSWFVKCSNRVLTGMQLCQPLVSPCSLPVSPCRQLSLLGVQFSWLTYNLSSHGLNTNGKLAIFPAFKNLCKGGNNIFSRLLHLGSKLGDTVELP